ncbi:hypothetical protein [Pseudoflavonifractor capillosus]|uniref:Copper amine oxidase N-terminal domain-containing protein n=1 Tax=Pseudoflavonifractor capillosus TaxID=106588 RepID=A0A921MK48_9FIRM|nr:hypothetical protein [Pseudoflavonifractor capillosus]HJG85652.1 copper amine oxidase N-terminal domain-containing protein [Pseudoflavonifractor capillosus]
MRRSFLSVLAGMLIGATMLGGGAYAAASGILAERSPHPVTVNGQPVEIEAYLIEGHNYYQLQDLGELLGFDVVWDGAAGTVRITTPDAPAAESSAGTVLLPSDGSRYIPQAGDVIRCDDGTNYTITDVSRWDKNMFAAGPVGDLPEPTCDWSLLPQPELPAPEARHYSINGREYLFVRNLYETRRMLYTLYNAIGDNPETWQNGAPVLHPSGNPKVKINLSIADDLNPQVFWPWRESEIVNLFNSCPPGTYSMEAWDVYKDGVFQRTEYNIHVR